MHGSTCTRQVYAAPLALDMVSTWMQHSLGGCQYHVPHPGGLSYETLPGNREFPFTLDLRRV